MTPYQWRLLARLALGFCALGGCYAVTGWALASYAPALIGLKGYLGIGLCIGLVYAATRDVPDPTP